MTKAKIDIYIMIIKRAFAKRACVEPLGYSDRTSCVQNNPISTLNYSQSFYVQLVKASVELFAF